MTTLFTLTTNSIHFIVVWQFECDRCSCYSWAKFKDITKGAIIKLLRMEIDLEESDVQTKESKQYELPWYVTHSQLPLLYFQWMSITRPTRSKLMWMGGRVVTQMFWTIYACLFCCKIKAHMSGNFPFWGVNGDIYKWGEGGVCPSFLAWAWISLVNLFFS